MTGCNSTNQIDEDNNNSLGVKMAVRRASNDADFTAISLNLYELPVIHRFKR